jgi:hypothetical protein
MDIIVGADHGQGTFKAGVNIVVRAGRNSPKCMFDLMTGEVECSKDSAEILQRTIMGPMNYQLKQMICKEIACCSDPDGTLWIYKPVEGSIYATFCENEKQADTDNLIHSIQFRILVNGDLAFYAATLGKENSAAHCCWLCQLCKTE